MNTLIDFIRFLLTFGSGEAQEAQEGGSFFADDDDDDEGDDGADEGDDDAGDDDDDDQDDDDDSDDEDDDDDQDDDDDDDLDDDDGDADDDDEEDAESEDDSESEGEGGEEDGDADAVSAVLRQATHARLKAEHSAAQGTEVPAIELDSLDRDKLKSELGMDDVEDESFDSILQIAVAVAGHAVNQLNVKAIQPIRTSETEKTRKARLTQDFEAFAARNKGWEKREKRMIEIYEEFDKEYGRDLADTVSFDDLYRMAGGTPATTRKKGKSARRKAKDQKRKSLRKQGQAARVTRSRSGGKRRRGKDADLIKQTEDFVRSTHFDPFTIPG